MGTFPVHTVDPRVYGCLKRFINFLLSIPLIGVQRVNDEFCVISAGLDEVLFLIQLWPGAAQGSDACATCTIG